MSDGSINDETADGANDDTANDTANDTAAAPATPLLRVVKGDPTPHELAALVAVVAARSSVVAAPRPKPRSEWGHPASMVRRPMRIGPGRWRASSW